MDAAIHDERRPTRHSSRRRDDDTTQDGNSNRSTATDTEQSDASCDAKFLSLSNAHRKMARSGDGKRAAGEPATKTGGREETRGDSDEDLTAPLHGNCFSSMTGGSSGDGDLLKVSRRPIVHVVCFCRAFLSKVYNVIDVRNMSMKQQHFCNFL